MAAHNCLVTPVSGNLTPSVHIKYLWINYFQKKKAVLSPAYCYISVLLGSVAVSWKVNYWVMSSSYTLHIPTLSIFLEWGCIRWLISQEHASQQVEGELGVITVSAPVWAPVRKPVFHQTGSLITSLSEMMSRGKRACQVCIRLISTARQYP